jgi:hypothetical protein
MTRVARPSIRICERAGLVAAFDALLIAVVALLAERVERAGPEDELVAFMSFDVIAYSRRSIDASALAHAAHGLCP